MTYHRKALMGLSALALAVSAVSAAPTVGPGKQIMQETNGVNHSGRFYTGNVHQALVQGVCTAGKCTVGQIGKECAINSDCNIWASVMDTGFEAPEWDAGFSICGDEFALGLTCIYPVSNVCIAKNHVASQNCCPDDPNEETGWSMSPSGRHCSQPAVTTVHPSAGLQHVRFTYDPAGGLPAGCNGFGSACRERMITSQIPVPQVSRTVYSYDIAFDGTLGMSMINFMGQDTNQGSIYLNTYMFWYYLGGLYIYDFSASTFAFGGYWSSTVPDYAKFTADLDPCNNVVTYSYNGAVVHSEPYGFTAPYGDPAADGFGSRKATTDTSFFTTDHYPPVSIDIDEHRVTHTPCSDACVDQDAGTCLDVPSGTCESKVVYPNTPCALLGELGYPPAAAVVTGSCCDNSPGAGGPSAAGVCANGVLEADCGGSQQTWVKGGACANVSGVCHIGAGSCGGATGCVNFPYTGLSCAVDSDCDVPGFCYPGTCSQTGFTGSCRYSTNGYCASGAAQMGRCSGSADCNPDTGAGCCDPGCSPPLGCPSGQTCIVERQDCDNVPGGADCAFCEGCTAWPNVGCDNDTQCPAPSPAIGAGFCVPNPLFGCYNDDDCSAGNVCNINKGGKAGQLCTSDDDCSLDASVCLENTGSCCNTLDGTCTTGRVQADCLGENPAQRIWLKLGDCSACSAVTGACCDEDPFGGCTDTVQAACDCDKCVWTKLGSCATTACVHNSIPTVSEWGIVVLTLLLLTGAKIYFGRRQTATA